MTVYAMPRMGRFLEQNGPWSQLVKLNNIVIKPLQHNQSVALNTLRVPPFWFRVEMNILKRSGIAYRAKQRLLFLYHTNPLLDLDSAESKQVKSKGFNIGYEDLTLSM